MAKKPKVIELPEGTDAPHEIIPSKFLRQATGVEDADYLERKLSEISELLWRHEGMSAKEFSVRRLRALELYESLSPADGAEGMLAAQMVGTHFAALDCLRRAAIMNQTFEGRDMALKHAQKLLALYTKQLDTLNKHRGKGQQKVTVEHVNVQSGGQAIVGNVEAGGKRGSEMQVPKLEEAADIPMETIKEPVKESTRQKSRKRKK